MGASDRWSRWRKRGDWLGLTAALMLGTGFGALASSALGRVAIAALLVGCVTFAWDAY